MNRLSILLAATCPQWAIAQPVPAVAFQHSITLTGVSGKFDHFAIDLAGNRLFAAATGNHSVEVIDLASGKVAQSITGLSKPHGLAWIAATQTLYVADGALAELRQYRGSPLALAGSLKLSDDADDMVYREAGKSLFVGHGGSGSATPGRIAVVDTVSFQIKSEIPVATHPEALEIDLEHQRIFANIADSGEVAVIDGSGRSAPGSWKLKGADHNVPLAYDSRGSVLYVACRAPAVLLALDGSTGIELARIPIAAGADDLFYDQAGNRVYVITGAGEVDIVKADSRKALRLLGKVSTAAGAKTALFVPSQSLLYVGVPAVAPAPSEVRVYSTQLTRGTN
jgi:DNA-binding beta-propeller fold protein YncE